MRPSLTSLSRPAKTTHKRYYFVAFAIALGLTALASSAQAQTLTVLYSFTGAADGTEPMGLVRDSAGNLYGTALYGGDLHCGDGSGCGTAFKLDATGTLTILHTFTGGADGAIPWGTLLLDSAGNKTMLYAFAGSLQGSLPYGSLVEDTKGNL